MATPKKSTHRSRFIKVKPKFSSELNQALAQRRVIYDHLLKHYTPKTETSPKMRYGQAPSEVTTTSYSIDDLTDFMQKAGIQYDSIGDYLKSAAVNGYVGIETFARKIEQENVMPMLIQYCQQEK